MPFKWSYLVAIIIILGIAFYLFYPKIENFFVFFPTRSFDFTPEEYQLTYRDVFFHSEDGKRLHGWFFPLQKGSPIILFCHGNAGNISHRLDNIRLLLEYGLQVFIFDYRGYGKSSAQPSEKGIYKDGIAAYDYLVHEKGFRPDEIIVFGRSLGAAVAIEIALKRRARALIIESAFTSIKEMAKTVFLFYPLTPLLPDHYNNLHKLAQIAIPKLIFHGEKDEIVPFHMGEKLFSAAPPPKYFYPIKDAGHNDTYIVGRKRYFQTFASFAKDGII